MYQIQCRDHRGMTSPSKKCGLVEKEDLEIDFCPAVFWKRDRWRGVQRWLLVRSSLRVVGQVAWDLWLKYNWQTTVILEGPHLAVTEWSDYQREPLLWVWWAYGKEPVLPVSGSFDSFIVASGSCFTLIKNPFYDATRIPRLDLTVTGEREDDGIRHEFKLLCVLFWLWGPECLPELAEVPCSRQQNSNTDTCLVPD